MRLPMAIIAGLMVGAHSINAAAPQQCDIALILSFDTSVSMDETEFRWMREGTANALRDEGFLADFEAKGATVYLQVVEWADSQKVVLDWMPVTSKLDLLNVATLLEQAPRSKVGNSTGLGNAILFGAAQLARVRCDRLVIDISSDGESNTGPHPQGVHKSIDPAIQINGLATTQQAADFLETYVIQGAGAFVEQTDGYAKFTEAMRNKLNQELFLGSAEATGGPA